MSLYDGVEIRFEESMSGYLGVGQNDPKDGARLGKLSGDDIRFDVRIIIDDLGEFFRDQNNEARLEGTVTFGKLGGKFDIRDGVYNLFDVDPATGHRNMEYAFRFTASDGKTYFLNGKKDIYDDRGKFDIVDDMTRLFTVVYKGDSAAAPVYGSGELFFHMKDAPSMAASVKVGGDVPLLTRIGAVAAFVSFAYGALREEYLKEVNIFYDTRYQNLVLTGKLEDEAGGKSPFFFVSGAHDKGFPWGDGGVFWDILLAVADGTGGYRRFAITEHVLEGMKLDVTGGLYRYSGPIYEINQGNSASYYQMRKNAPHLKKCTAEIAIDFNTTRYGTTVFPFPLMPKALDKVLSKLSKAQRDALPGENPAGINITPHTVNITSGTVMIESDAGVDSWKIDAPGSFGEAEESTFRSVKEPTMLYGYVCAPDITDKTVRVQIYSDTLRDEPNNWAKDRLDAYLGDVIAGVGSAEMKIEGGKVVKKPLPPTRGEGELAVPLEKLGAPILELNNDHMPTGIFQRRIIKVMLPSRETCLALEEDMSLMRLDSMESNRKVKVASIRDEDMFVALDTVLDATGFIEHVDAALAGSGKDKDSFHIVIKPNFMFAYSKLDKSTFTDPQLVGHLVKRLRDSGYSMISVAEARSTYGEFFENREVKNVAKYLGYDVSGAAYEVVDMTEEALGSNEHRDFGPHLGRHPVSPTWRDADYRISFAKNKTHTYAYYTLTLKNIYGALPHQNKFKEYHCERDIYKTTIEYLAAYPVHFGLIDAYLSADGPFGIFADPDPNPTKTIIGGPDLVAVDWVASTKMGVNPMVSPYMEYAVEKFGKPEIELIGDETRYRPWLNVPTELTLMVHKGLDADFKFGNFIYMSFAYMDKEAFPDKPGPVYKKPMRMAGEKLTDWFFVKAGQDPSVVKQELSEIFRWLGD